MPTNLSLLLLIRRRVDLLPLLLRQEWHLGLIAVRRVFLPAIVPVVNGGLLFRHAVVAPSVDDSFEKHALVLSVARAAVVGVEEMILALDGVVLRRLCLLLPQA